MIRKTTRTTCCALTALSLTLLITACNNDSDDPARYTAQPFEETHPHGAMLHLIESGDSEPTIGYNNSLSMQANQSCFSYQQVLNQGLGNGSNFTMDTNETSSAVQSVLGVTTSVGLKMKVVKLNEYNQFVRTQTANRAGVSIFYNVGGYQGFTNQINSVGDNYLKLSAADFARTCGSTVLTNYVGSYKIYVSLSVQSDNDSFNQSINNTVKTKIKFVDLMNEVNKQQSSTSANVEIIASYYTLGLPQSASAAILGVFGDKNFSDCVQLQNVASSCTAFDSNLTNAIAKIEQQVQQDINAQKAFYLYYNPVASTSTYAPVGSLGIKGLEKIADAFVGVEQTFTNNLNVVFDLNTAVNIADDMASNSSIGKLPANALLAIQDSAKAYASNRDTTYSALQNCINSGACSTSNIPRVSVAGLLAKAPVALQNLYLMALSPRMNLVVSLPNNPTYNYGAPAVWFYRTANSGTGYDLDITAVPGIGSFTEAQNLEVANVELDISKLPGTLAATWTNPPETTGDLFTLHDQTPGCTLTGMNCQKTFSGSSTTLTDNTWTVDVKPNPDLFLTVMQPVQ